MGKLYGKSACTATGAIDQHLLSRLDLSFCLNALQGNHGSLRDGCGLLERQTCWFPCEELFGNTGIFGETTSIEWHLSKDFIPGLKSPDVFANPFHLPGDIGPEDLVPWLAKSSEAGIQRFASQSFPIRSIDGYRMYLYQNFVVGRNRHIDLFQSENIGRTVLELNNRFHKVPSQ